MVEDNRPAGDQSSLQQTAGQTAVDFWAKEAKKRKKYDVNGKDSPNNTKSLVIRYESGLIYGKQNIDKTPGVIKRGIRKFFSSKWSWILTPVLRGINELSGRRIVRSDSDNSDLIVGYQDNGGYVDGVFFSEYFAYDKSKKGKPPQGDKVVGCYVFPYFKGRAHSTAADSESGKTSKRYVEEKATFIVDTHDIAHHYLYNHCYYNFQVYGEDFAKIYGIEKMTASNDFGFEYNVVFSQYVAWNMTIHIIYGGVFEKLNFNCILKEDLNPSDGGLAKWLVGAVGSVALAAASGGASLIGTAAAGTKAVHAAEDKAWAVGEKLAHTPYKNKDGSISDRLYGWKDSDTQRVADAHVSEKIKQDDIWNAELKEQAGAVGKSVGKAFCGMGRTFAGGSGSYSSSVKEFIFSKAKWPTFFLQARTGLRYQSFWVSEMNRRISTYDFYFGKDPEIALRKGFGMEFGKGYKKDKDSGEITGVLKDLHGWIQLQDTIVFFGQYNPFIDYWIGTDIFVYQLRISKRPKLEFFEAFKGEIAFALIQDGGNNELTIENKHERTNDQNVNCSDGVVFTYLWVQGGCSSSGNFVVTNDGEGGNVGSGDKINRYTGSNETPERISSFPSDAPLEQPYQKVDFANASPGEEIILGGGKYCFLKYMKLDKKEEEFYEAEKPDETTWVLKKAEQGTYGDKTVNLIKRTYGVDIIAGKLETGFDPLNLQFRVPIAGMSGIEGWGANPPDAFSGGGQGGISIPGDMNTTEQLTPGMGLTLPETNALNTNLQMPEQISSQLSGQEINLNLTPLEMPKMQEIGTSQQEWISGQQTTEGFGEQSGWYSTDRGQGQPGFRKQDQDRKKKN